MEDDRGYLMESKDEALRLDITMQPENQP